MKTGRNSPCPCGSGDKYKSCCGPKKGKRTPIMVIVGGVVVAGLVLTGIFASRSGSSSQTPAPADSGSAPAPAGGPGTPQPPGPAPEGKVWSAEHGHWHDAPKAGDGVTLSQGSGAQPGAAQPAASQPGTPQPPGPAPPGKVWSVEHGHWHDAPSK